MRAHKSRPARRPQRGETVTYHRCSRMKKLFITCAFAAAIAAGASDAKERRLPDEGAFCLERALGEPDLPDGYCVRVCAAGPKECHRRERRLRAENPKLYKWLIWGKR